jgi:precorrin-6B methylase 2
VAAPLTTRLRAHPPLLHGGGSAYFGLSWDALEWIEERVESSMRTLETGTGSSTIIFAAAGSSHVAISPAPEEHERIRAYCRENGISTDRVNFVAAPSHEALAGEPGEPDLDVALLDGAHGFPYPVLDWMLVAPRLRVDGHILVDDAYLEPVTPLVRYLRASPSWELEAVLGQRTPCFRKLDATRPSFGVDVPSRSSYGYLPLLRRPGAWARLSLMERPPLLQVVRWLSQRRMHDV